MISGQQVPVAPVFEFKIVELRDDLFSEDGPAGSIQEAGTDERNINALAADGWAIVGVIPGIEISELIVSGHYDLAPPRIVMARQIGFRVVEMPGVIGTPGLKLT